MQVTQSKQYVISNGRLEIMQILKKDEGKYICRAVNIAGLVETAAYLTIKGEIEILDVNLESHVFEQQVMHQSIPAVPIPPPGLTPGH